MAPKSGSWMVGEDHKVMRRSVSQDHLIRSGRWAYHRPVHRLDPGVAQPGDPPWREVHVDQELHRPTGSTSRSSARHAA